MSAVLTSDEKMSALNSKADEIRKFQSETVLTIDKNTFTLLSSEIVGSGLNVLIWGFEEDAVSLKGEYSINGGEMNRIIRKLME